MHSSPSYSLYDLFSCHSTVSQTSSTDTGGERGKAFFVVTVTAAINTCTGINKKAMAVIWNLCYNA